MSAPDIGSVLKGYVKSNEFRHLSKASKKSYSYALDKWEPYLSESCDRAVELAIHIRDELWEDKPGMARLFLSVSSAMFGWAFAHRLLLSNPVKGLPRPKGGAHKQWPDRVVEEVLATAPPHIGTACLIGLQTAQRIGDICAAKQVDIRDGVWHLRQSKIGTELRIPLTQEVLEAIDNKSVWMLGQRWRPEYLSSLVGNHLKKLGYDGFTFHGLRKVAASRMAERGCTVEELAAITGHKTLAVVQHYIRGADQARLAQNAMAKTFGA